MKALIVTLIFTLFVFPLWGQRIRTSPADDVFSNEYSAGPYLMYDCEQGFWVCGGVSEVNDCKHRTQVWTDSTTLPCVVLSELPSKRSCYEYQLRMVIRNRSSRFCYRPEFERLSIQF